MPQPEGLPREMMHLVVASMALKSWAFAVLLLLLVK
jgi:hypothetical protein